MGHTKRHSLFVFAGALATLGAGLGLEAWGSASASVQTANPTAQAQAPGPTTGVREASWSPDSKRLAVSWFEAIWTMTPDGRDAKRVTTKPDRWISERDPAWSPDGKSIAFSADTDGQFDLWIAPASGGTSRRVTTAAGDERWPSWTPDGRIVYSHRDSKGVWQLFVSSADGSGTPLKLTPDTAAEWQGRVSPDGKLVAFIADREIGANDDGDVWVRELPGASADGAKPRTVRVTSLPGLEGYPAWAPDNARVAYAAPRAGQNSIWVSVVPPIGGPVAPDATGRAGGGRPGGAGGRQGNAAQDLPLLASRHGGVAAWSPDSQTLAIATFVPSNAAYNGNPNRNDDDAPTAFASTAQFALWRVDAPRAIDANAAALSLPSPDNGRWVTAIDRAWQTIKSLYYTSGPSAAAWDAVREKYRAQAVQAKDAASAEDVIDAMVAEQPLIKPGAESGRGVVTSAHPLASKAGADILAKGGNVVDAGIAVALALGVVEPDATSLGGDGQAILFLKGMSEPVVIEYKDMTPGHATPDNPKLFTPTGGRVATDGPTVAAIPGVAAGLDLLYQKYGSKKVTWADLVAPAITLADEGFILDEALPTSIAEGREAFAKYAESAKLFLPGGRVPKPGDRFVNKDYAETLRLLAKEGGRSFYTGTIARRIVEDMAANGGVFTADDLAQYRAMERKPLSGKYHDHLVYSVPAPVSNGAQMIETLNILDNYKPRSGATYTTDADYFHYVLDAWRVRDGGGRIADPERWTVDYGDHLEPAHALERFKLIDPIKAYGGAGGRGNGPGQPGDLLPVDWPDPSRHVQSGTTAFVVADGEGNMIAFTQTLSTWGGNYYVSKGLGFLYNDHFRGGGGRGGGGLGSMLPLTRSSSTSVPTLVFEPNGSGGYTPQIAVGCAGNAWIPASVYNIITNVVDSKMDAQHAIEAPRFLIGGGTNIQIEDRFPRALLADMESRGYTFTKVGRKGEVKYGYASVAVVSVAKGTAQAGADPRRSHGAAAPGGR